MRDFGSTPSPHSAFLLSLGLESLPVRMERHCSNALKMAEFLESSDKVAWVNYPDLTSNKYNALAKKYLPKGSCGVISFGIRGGRSARRRIYGSSQIGFHRNSRSRLQDLLPPPCQLYSQTDD